MQQILSGYEGRTCQLQLLALLFIKTSSVVLFHIALNDIKK